MSTSALDAELATVARRHWWNKSTIVLGVALLLVGGFIAGAEVQKAHGEPTTVAGPGGGGTRGQGGFTPPTAFPGGGSPFDGGQNANGSTPATTGTVKLVDGITVYVETGSGEVITVRTDEETAVSLPGELESIKAGDTVTVAGETDAEGTVSASSVTKTG